MTYAHRYIIYLCPVGNCHLFAVQSRILETRTDERDVIGLACPLLADMYLCHMWNLGENYIFVFPLLLLKMKNMVWRKTEGERERERERERKRGTEREKEKGI